ncbi:hypothetical protein MKY66_00965 [Paenibacillus sp. FSL R5-0766]|uniref:hypothetical protein n=1 Tax=unclassified Paenibacillus TaxID=185978 RepID=UPI00096E1626|nr:hypothetical protein [Paenibacillus sp. FSL R5-0765]OMF56538.1 hypothetical protein BK141_26915 [Paenibacillus sp. FSL R5-0765]
MANTFKYSDKYWRDEVKKYIFARLDSLWSDNGIHDDLLDSFIKSILQTSGDDLKWLAAIYHINRREGALHYVLNILPEYMNTLSRKNDSYITTSSAVRGKVLWSRTYLQRLTTRDLSTFVIQDNNKNLDSDENRLLLFYLTQLANINVPAAWSISKTENRIGDKLVGLIKASRKLLQSTYLKEVSLVSTVTERMLSQASKNRNPVYSNLVNLYLEYETIMEKPSLELVKSLFEYGWIQPKVEEHTDDLFELFVLLSTLNTIENILKNQRQSFESDYNLIRPGGSHIIARFRSEKVDIQIMYDRSPEKLFGISQINSLYKRILGMYEGISGSARRPDILLKINDLQNKQESRLLIEVKNTDAGSSYANESIYKALGYLKDYDGFWKVDQYPKIVLAYPDGIKAKSEIDGVWLEQDLVLISGNLKKDLKQIIEKFLMK